MDSGDLGFGAEMLLAAVRCENEMKALTLDQ